MRRGYEKSMDTKFDAQRNVMVSLLKYLRTSVGVSWYISKSHAIACLKLSVLGNKVSLLSALEIVLVFVSIKSIYNIYLFGGTDFNVLTF